MNQTARAAAYGLHLSALSLALMAASSAYAAEPLSDGRNPLQPQAEMQGEGSLNYVGDGTRIGIGYEKDEKARVELYQVFSEGTLDAWIGEAWFARDAGGLRFSYHWLPALDGSDQAVEGAAVRKLFFAADQNEFDDRKATFGFGLENEAGFGALYLARGLSDARQIGSLTERFIETREGLEGDRPFIDTITTTRLTRTFEQAYDWGIGARLGTLFRDSLLRVTGGLDYEWGEADSHQTTLSVELEKFFSNSPHSLSLRLETLRKAGDFEVDRDDTRVMAMYRFEFGGRGAGNQWIGSFRPETLVRQVRTTAPAAASEQLVEKKEQQIVKTTATMASDAFFELNRAVLTASAKAELDKVIATLNAQGYEGNLRVVGHTCDLGREAYNLKLSQRRAEAVRDYLASQGLPAARIVTEGKGESEPKFPNSDAERSKNRRVDLEFVTYVEKTEEVIVKVPASSSETQTAPVEWQREVVAQEPAWVRRALHNTIRHKTRVDVYRTQETDTTVDSQRQYLNRAPIAAADTFSMMSGKEASFDILANDRDPDGDALSVTAITLVAPSDFSPKYGEASLVNNKLVLKTVREFSGPVSYQYQLRDAQGKVTSATVTVNVALSNTAPKATDDSASTPMATPVQIAVLANDSDADNDSFAISALGTPAHGTATLQDGIVTYTPASGFSGEDQFSYTLKDSFGATSTAVVRVTVAGKANGLPVAVDDRVFVSGKVPTTFSVLGNDSDPDGDALTIIAVSQPVDGHGTVSIVNNQILFTPKAPFMTDQFTYTVSDGNGGTATATVFLFDP